VRSALIQAKAILNHDWYCYGLWVLGYGSMVEELGVGLGLRVEGLGW
jgi:hypothetical protein